MEKTILSRVISKHDITENWDAAEFIPKLGEIIVYTDDKRKFKVGDGINKPRNLSFTSSGELPEIVKDKYLHTNALTGELEWVDVQSGGSERFTQEITIQSEVEDYIINHNLNSREVVVIVYDKTTLEDAIVDIQRTSVNSVKLTFIGATTGQTFVCSVFTPGGAKGEKGDPGSLENIVDITTGKTYSLIIDNGELKLREVSK